MSIKAFFRQFNGKAKDRPNVLPRKRRVGSKRRPLFRVRPSRKNPLKKLNQKTFYFHFENLQYAYGRKNSFLCYEVNWINCGVPVSTHQGVFSKEGYIHAELCFLYWFHDQVLNVLPPGEEFKVTWYTSWSPCSLCAEEVARFLATHRNLSLAIFISRFYNLRDLNYPRKLCRLLQEGAHVAVMGLPEFKKCWNNFVFNGAQPFRPWKRLGKNFCFQDFKLQEILSKMNMLREDIFYLQFNNSRRVKPQGQRYYHRKPYLCYQLEQPNGQEPLKGCLLHKRGKQHIEIFFLEKMRSMELKQARITCYLTWSPCPYCARQLAAFKKDRPDLILHIYTSRLYFHWRRKFQKGLCSLWRSGIQVDVMSLPQFTDCWTNFVNQQKPFRPWNGLEKNSWCIQRRLRRIKESWGLQDLVNDFENLQLGPPLP